MNRSNAALALAALLAGAGGCIGSAPPSSGTPNHGPLTEGGGDGWVSAGGLGINVRQRADTGSAIVASIADGTEVTIACQTSGESIAGTTIWDYLPDYGGYATDAYIYTGTDGFLPGVPRCGDDGQTGGGGGGGSLGATIASLAESYDGYIEQNEAYCNAFSTALGRACEQWCADFADYVWQQAGADIGGLDASAISFYGYGTAHGTWKDGAYAANVQPGDAVIWAFSYGWAEHVGIVSAVGPGNQLTVVNGDFFDDGPLSRVSEVTITRDDDEGTGAPILGYASAVAR